MPIYEYKREDGSTFELHQSMKDDALEECPETGQKCKRIISGGVTTVLKGTNWPGKQVNKHKKLANAKNATTLPEYQKKIEENTEKARNLNEKRS